MSSYFKLSSEFTEKLSPSDFSALNNLYSPFQMNSAAYKRGALEVLQGTDHCDWLLPKSAEYTIRDIEDLQKKVRVSTKEFFSIPLILEKKTFLGLSRHLVHVLIQKDKRKMRIEFFNSKPSWKIDINTHRILKKLDPLKDVPIFTHNQPLQRRLDCTNCGAFVLYHLKKRVVERIDLEDKIPPPESGIWAFRKNIAKQAALNAVFPQAIEDEGFVLV